jgi:hypothetical protein
MTIVALNPEQSTVELLDDQLLIHNLELTGAVVELAHELELSGQPEALARLLRQVVDTGAVVVAHGKRRAELDAITGEIDRLIGQTSETTAKLPEAIQAQLNEHLAVLGKTLAEHFDAGHTSSVQQQLKQLVNGASAEQVKAILRDLLGENGPLSASHRQVDAQLKLLVGSNQDMLATVTSLVERLDARDKLAEQHERSPHKGMPFEDVVDIELNAIHTDLGDDVRCVKHDTGVIPGSATGDFVVALNPTHTRGRELRVVVEAKTGKLYGPEARKVLEEAIKNRDACVGILVFDGVEDAPLRGRRYLAYPNGRIACVLEPDGDPLAFQIACNQARLFALATLESEGAVDAKWLHTQTDHLCALIEEAAKIKRNTARIRRSADAIDDTYQHLRDEALGLLDQVRLKLV